MKMTTLDRAIRSLEELRALCDRSAPARLTLQDERERVYREGPRTLLTRIEEVLQDVKSLREC